MEIPRSLQRSHHNDRIIPCRVSIFKMIGKKMAASGISNVLIEGGLTTSESIKATLSESQHNRTEICHNTMVEALERILLKVRCNFNL